MITDIDKKHLKRCIELAQEALDKGDQPFGSVLVSADGEILFEDHNHVSNGDHTQHPEFNIARWAGQNMTEQERKVATVYTSGEHCPMCAAAHGAVKLGRIVYASSSKQLTKWHKEFGVLPWSFKYLKKSLANWWWIFEVVREYTSNEIPKRSKLVLIRLW